MLLGTRQGQTRSLSTGPVPAGEGPAAYRRRSPESPDGRPCEVSVTPGQGTGRAGFGMISNVEGISATVIITIQEIFQR